MGDRPYETVEGAESFFLARIDALEDKLAKEQALADRLAAVVRERVCEWRGDCECEKRGCPSCHPEDILAAYREARKDVKQ